MNSGGIYTPRGAAIKVSIGGLHSPCTETAHPKLREPVSGNPTVSQSCLHRMVPDFIRMIPSTDDRVTLWVHVYASQKMPPRNQIPLVNRGQFF